MVFHSVLRCLAATLFAFATSTVATFGQVPALQPANSMPGKAPAPAAAMAAYREIDGWVRAWTVPEELPGQRAELTGLGGICVQLRLDGELIGHSQVFPATGESGAAAAQKAAREAMAEAEGRLRIPNDAMRDEALREQAKRIQISLDLAGPLTAIEPAAWIDAELMLSPGLEGVAAVVRDEGTGAAGRLAAAFPSFLIATNTLPHRALSGICSQVMGEGGAAAAMEEPKQIRARHGVHMYKFRSTHLAQCKPGAEPVFLFRGARLIDLSEMTTGELRQMAEGMARHLSASASLCDGFGLGYTYQPTTGEVDRVRKPSAESTALGLLAIEQFVELGHAHVLPESLNLVRAAWRTSAELLGRRAEFFQGDDETTLFLLAIADRPDSELAMPVGPGDCMPHSFQEPLKSQILREWPDGDMFGGIQSPARAVCALAYARWPVSRPIEEGALEQSLPEIDRQIRMWVASIPKEHLVAHMPWLGWAEIELAKHNAAAAGAPVDIPSAVALREMRRQVWEHQIGVMDVDQDSMDMAGGIVFTKAASPLPTWQCTRPLAFIATMLGDARLTEPEERGLELARLLQSLRFIRQLQADETIGWMARDPATAVGGVRAAPWDQSMPPDATSMALLTVVEAIRALESIAAEAAAPPP